MTSAKETALPAETLRHTLEIGGMGIAYPGDALLRFPESLMGRIEDCLADQDGDIPARLVAAIDEVRRRGPNL